jgi:hypothetical protein
MLLPILEEEFAAMLPSSPPPPSSCIMPSIDALAFKGTKNNCFGDAFIIVNSLLCSSKLLHFGASNNNQQEHKQETGQNLYDEEKRSHSF